MIKVTDTQRISHQPNALETSKRLVIIDSNIANLHQLAAGVIPGTIVKILDAHRDGIIQITEILQSNPHIETLHLISHASPGCLYLGNSELSLDTLTKYTTKISTWFSSKSPRLLIYGCNVAQGDAGEEFIGKLQKITKANIQVSSTKVGNSSLGGNWLLDIAIGDLFTKSPIAFTEETQNTYQGVFADPVANDDPFPATLELSELNGSNGFVLNGVGAGFNADDGAGSSVSNAGDLNGDGIDDIIIGADGADPNGNLSGESYVVFGSNNIGIDGTLELSALNGSNGFVLNGIDALSSSGRSVSNAGDINNDGINDLIIGAPGAEESYVVFGGSNIASSGTLELSELNGSNGFVLNGIDAFDSSGSSGFSVSNAGDLNGDGINDIIIGAYTADPNGNSSGESYVVFGSSNVGSSGTLELSALNGSLNGIDSGDFAGRSVSNAGDINADGINDIIIGASSASPNGNRSGESYVVFGDSNVGNSGTLELSALNGNNGFVLNGIDSGDRSGRSVSNAGDLNGDGIDDIIIGAYTADSNGSNSGESYVVFGDSNIGSSGTLELSTLNSSNGFVLNGIDVGDRSGISVSNAGDINADGIDDIINWGRWR